MTEFGHNIIVRTLSGMVLLVIVLAAILLSEYSFAALVLVIGTCSMWEFYNIASRGFSLQSSNHACTAADIDVNLHAVRSADHDAATESGNCDYTPGSGNYLGAADSDSRIYAVDSGSRVAGGDKYCVANSLWRYSTAVGSLAIAVSFFVASGRIGSIWLLAIIPLVSMIFIAEIFRQTKPVHQNTSLPHRQFNPLLSVSVAIAGIVYAAMPMALMIFMAFGRGAYDPRIILTYIFIVWMNDVFAYMTGVSLGRHKLCERISPKKSWEGFIGGLLFAIAFAVLCGYIGNQNLWVWAGFGLLIAISAVLGDLTESMFKRWAGVKDSGRAIPGHGGFMDRFDAMLMSAPFAFFYTLIFNL